MTRSKTRRRGVSLARYRQQVLHGRDAAFTRLWNQPGPLHHARKQGHLNAARRREDG